MKTKSLIISSTLLLLVSIASYFYVRHKHSNVPIECYGNVEVINGNLTLKGVLINTLHDRNGSILINGKVFEDDKPVSTINRWVRVNLQRSNSTVFMTSTKIEKKMEDNTPDETTKRLLSAFSITVGASSTYDFIRQSDGGYIVQRGTMPILYCGS
ncbi:hypothetical protein PMPD1_0209 [Paramixta manurensis]|uniref:Uncharacterized protein n=1 Tax=Paramixta manurensis TaxID=2740817 RepID=A0A6M8UEJ0_9GAMM|nr:hypothetical protein PMPD1_0209 [Erwiniaceae bacterium PD-1]